MKRKLIIVEDDFCRYFSMKQIIESHAKISLSVIMLDDPAKLSIALKQLTPGRLLVKPKDGICGLLSTIKKGNHNRRNTEAIMILTDTLDAMFERNLRAHFQIETGLLDEDLALCA